MAENYRRLDDPYFDYDPAARMRQRLVIDDDGIFHFQNIQEVSDTIDYAHEHRGAYAKSERLGDMVKVATVPLVIIHDLMQRGIWQDRKKRAAWLNSAEGRVWKTRDINL